MKKFMSMQSLTIVLLFLTSLIQFNLKELYAFLYAQTPYYITYIKSGIAKLSKQLKYLLILSRYTYTRVIAYIYTKTNALIKILIFLTSLIRFNLKEFYAFLCVLTPYYITYIKSCIAELSEQLKYLPALSYTRVTMYIYIKTNTLIYIYYKYRIYILYIYLKIKLIFIKLVSYCTITNKLTYMFTKEKQYNLLRLFNININSSYLIKLFFICIFFFISLLFMEQIITNITYIMFIIIKWVGSLLSIFVGWFSLMNIRDVTNIVLFTAPEYFITLVENRTFLRQILTHFADYNYYSSIITELYSEFLKFSFVPLENFVHYHAWLQSIEVKKPFILVKQVYTDDFEAQLTLYLFDFFSTSRWIIEPEVPLFSFTYVGAKTYISLQLNYVVGFSIIYFGSVVKLLSFATKCIAVFCSLIFTFIQTSFIVAADTVSWFLGNAFMFWFYVLTIARNLLLYAFTGAIWSVNDVILTGYTSGYFSVYFGTVIRLCATFSVTFSVLSVAVDLFDGVYALTYYFLQNYFLIVLAANSVFFGVIKSFLQNAVTACFLLIEIAGCCCTYLSDVCCKNLLIWWVCSAVLDFLSTPLSFFDTFACFLGQAALYLFSLIDVVFGDFVSGLPLIFLGYYLLGFSVLGLLVVTCNFSKLSRMVRLQSHLFKYFVPAAVSQLSDNPLGRTSGGAREQTTVLNLNSTLSRLGAIGRNNGVAFGGWCSSTPSPVFIVTKTDSTFYRLSSSLFYFSGIILKGSRNLFVAYRAESVFLRSFTADRSYTLKLAYTNLVILLIRAADSLSKNMNFAVSLYFIAVNFSFYLRRRFTAPLNSFSGVSALSTNSTASDLPFQYLMLLGSLPLLMLTLFFDFFYWFSDKSTGCAQRLLLHGAEMQLRGFRAPFNSRLLSELGCSKLQFSPTAFAAKDLAVKYFLFVDQRRPQLEPDVLLPNVPAPYVGFDGLMLADLETQFFKHTLFNTILLERYYGYVPVEEDTADQRFWKYAYAFTAFFLPDRLDWISRGVLKYLSTPFHLFWYIIGPDYLSLDSGNKSFGADARRNFNASGGYNFGANGAELAQLESTFLKFLVTNAFLDIKSRKERRETWRRKDWMGNQLLSWYWHYHNYDKWCFYFQRRTLRRFRGSVPRETLYLVNPYKIFEQLPELVLTSSVFKDDEEFSKNFKLSGASKLAADSAEPLAYPVPTIARSRKSGYWRVRRVISSSQLGGVNLRFTLPELKHYNARRRDSTSLNGTNALLRRYNVFFSELRGFDKASSELPGVGVWSFEFLPHDIFFKWFHYSYWTSKQAFFEQFLHHEKFQYYKRFKRRVAWAKFKNLRAWRQSVRRNHEGLWSFNNYKHGRLTRKLALFFYTLRNDAAGSSNLVTLSTAPYRRQSYNLMSSGFSELWFGSTGLVSADINLFPFLFTGLDALNFLFYWTLRQILLIFSSFLLTTGLPPYLFWSIEIFWKSAAQLQFLSNLREDTLTRGLLIHVAGSRSFLFIQHSQSVNINFAGPNCTHALSVPDYFVTFFVLSW